MQTLAQGWWITVSLAVELYSRNSDRLQHQYENLRGYIGLWWRV